ncbi:uncharacterized protein [Amphiura filiformis]|uniref:uncharacterized protein isoform X2 n=1 Tax=Amphiura filiformis TaxID=82378 RepID=UPI003B20CCE5
MIVELKEEMGPFAAHLFQKDWQHKQYNLLRDKLPNNTCISVLDFAENYKCAYQDEVQGAYWTQNSATVHPIVCYYRCPSQNCNKPVTESLVFISDDLTHDYHSVHAFQEKACNHLASKRGLTLQKLYRYSDGCGQQYKSKGPFSDISYSIDDYGFPIEHFFAGSRHGKGPSDGESAVIKSRATIAVKSGAAIIKHAKELHTFAEQTCALNPEEDCNQIEKHSYRRTCFFISHEDINRDRGDRYTKTVPGTMKLHSVKSVKTGVVATRNLSCFCDACLQLDGSAQCQNAAYVGGWKEEWLFNKHNSGGNPIPHEDVPTAEDETHDATPEDVPTAEDETHDATPEDVPTAEDKTHDATPEDVPTAEDETPSTEIVYGSWVKIKFKTNIYYAEVTDTGEDNDDEIQVRYLKQVGDTYSRVEQPHYLSWIDRNECEVVPVPDITRRGTYRFLSDTHEL